MPDDKDTAPHQFFTHLPAIGAAAVGAVCAALLGSFLGTAGTVIGMAVGSMASGTISWWAERGMRKANAAAKAKADAIRHLGRPLHPSETAAITRTTTREHDLHIRWGLLGGTILTVFLVCALSVTLIERAVGRPLSDVVTGHQGTGTTLGGGGAPPSTSAPATATHSTSGTPTATTREPSPTPDRTTATPSSSPLVSPSAAASAISSAISSAVSSVASEATSQPTAHPTGHGTGPPN